MPESEGGWFATLTHKNQRRTLSGCEFFDTHRRYNLESQFQTITFTWPLRSLGSSFAFYDATNLTGVILCAFPASFSCFFDAICRYSHIYLKPSFRFTYSTNFFYR